MAIDVMLRERHSLSPGYEYATVPPGATHGLPVIGVETTVLKIRPHDAGCAFSDDAIDWDGPDDVFFIAAPYARVPGWLGKSGGGVSCCGLLLNQR